MPFDTREFDAKLTRMMRFVESDAIPIAAVIAQDTLARLSPTASTLTKQIVKPSDKWKRGRKGQKQLLQPAVEINDNSGAQQKLLDSKQFADAVRDGLQQHIERLWT